MIRLGMFLLLVLASTLWCQKFSVVTEEYPPYNYTTNGMIVGIATETIQEILKNTGLDYDLKVYPWARAYKMALEDPNTIIYSLTYTDERAPKFKWVGPLIPTKVVLIAKKSKQIKITKPDDLKKYKIGVVKDDIGEQLLLGMGVAKTNLEQVASPDLNAKKMNVDRIDILAYEENVAYWNIKDQKFKVEDYETIYTLKSGDLYIGFNIKTADDVIKKCQTALDELKKNGTFTKFSKKYLK